MLRFAGLTAVAIAMFLLSGAAQAQEQLYQCNNERVCIDSITYSPPSPYGGPGVGGTLIIHWSATSPPLTYENYDFWQVRYTTPGAADVQVKIDGPHKSGAQEGTYSLPLGPNPNGTYIIKVQGCSKSDPLYPSDCWGGNEQLWDVRTYTYPPPPPPVPHSGRAATCLSPAQQVSSPCFCAPGANNLTYPDGCDPYGTGVCLTSAQLTRVPNCTGATYLVCTNLPPIASRDRGGQWFNTVGLTCRSMLPQKPPGLSNGSLHTPSLPSNSNPPPGRNH